MEKQKGKASAFLVLNLAMEDLPMYGKIKTKELKYQELYDLFKVKNDADIYIKIEHAIKGIFHELQKILTSEITLYDKFEQFLETLQKHNFVSKDINLSDFLDVEELKAPFDEVNNTNFIAHFAPILILGGGIGLGFGEIWRPLSIFLKFL